MGYRSACSLIIAAVLACLPARADLPAQMIKRASVGWAALVCSALAQTAGLKEQGDRLFNMGYENGKTYLAGTSQDDIKTVHNPDFNTLYAFVMMPGPNVEFRMGMVWYAAMEEAERIITDKGVKRSELERIKALSGDEFKVRNCALI